MADPWNGWPILFRQAAGETVWQRDIISRIVGSTSDSVLVKVNGVGLFTAAYITEVQDNDGDGHSLAQGDCNDNNLDVYPGAVEVCENQTDDNCNGQVDENCIAIETVLMNGLEWQKVGHLDNSPISRQLLIVILLLALEVLAGDCPAKMNSRSW